ISAKELTFDFKRIIERSRKISERISKNVEMLIKKNKAVRIRGFGRLASQNKIDIYDDKNKKVNSISADHIIIATGAKPKSISSIPVDKKLIITSTEAMILPELPKELIVIGAGAIGVEFAYFYSVLGTKVTVIEVMENILPIEDKDVSKELEKSFNKRGIKIITGANVQKAEVKGKKVKVTVSVNGKNEELTSDKVLNAIGVTGNVEGFGLEELGIELYKNHIKVDKSTYETNVKDIYAIGDVIGPPWLAHVASHEAIHCLLGAHIIGSEATELIAEIVLARELEATGESIIKTVHAHPTLSESIMESAAQAYGEAIHI
ncbi:MAG: FAD-dependent oxidoreductase, partial [Ignavibacteriaceae bacterium]